MSARKAVACIGAGVIGRSWAVAFAAGGADVAVHDVSGANLARAREFAAAALADLEAFGRCPDASEAMQRLVFTEDFEAAVASADYVQESIAEDPALKSEVFARLDRLVPRHAVLASSTSTIPASSFLADLAGRRRCVVAHPVNPPHLIPVVEICPAPFTAPEIVERAVALMTSLDRVPVVLKKEVPGFLVNRLQLAVIGEALHLVAEGYCSATELDRAVKHSLGLRWSLLGPFEAGHLNADGGYHEYMKKFEPAVRKLIADLHVDYDWSEDDYRRIGDELSAAVPPESIAAKQAERDRDLAALLQYFDAAASRKRDSTS